jgi:hypothetical protein
MAGGGRQAPNGRDCGRRESTARATTVQRGLPGQRTAQAGEPEAVGHHHEQRPLMDKGKFLPEEARIGLRLAPEGRHRAQVAPRGDESDSNRIAATGRGPKQRAQLSPLGGRRAGVLRQEQRLGRQYVGRRIAIGARHCRMARAREREQRRDQSYARRQGSPLGGVRTVRQLPMNQVGTSKSMVGWRRAAVALATLVAVAAVPATARAHGPIAPIASTYLAKPAQVPAGLDAKTVDGDQRMWLRVPAAQTVVVLDYRGAPYLRFSRNGVEVNHNSEMYYLNQTPVAETPPANLTASTPPDWHRASSGHQYGWHDGRLHALATVALTPGSSFVGRWTIPVRVNGGASAIAGGLYHADNPSLVWFWPIVVVLACVLAAWRIGSEGLDARVTRGLAIIALVSIVAGSAAKQLHGRPTVGGFALIEFVVIVALVAWSLWRVLSGRAGFFMYFAIAFFAVAVGLELLPTLLHGFALTAVPAFVARSLAVVCLGTGIGLLPYAFRMAARADAASPSSAYDDELEEDDDGALGLA